MSSLSGHKYTTNSSNLFEDDDDIDDETFLKNFRNSDQQHHSTNPFLTNSPPSSNNDQHQVYEARKKEIEDRTLGSSYRSIGLLRETEQVGVSTAEELLRQREQLENTSKQLDDIGTTLRFSQKHLNGLKSVFGGLKNYLSGQKDMQPPSSSSLSRRMSPAQSDSKLASDGGGCDSINSMTSNKSDGYNNHGISGGNNDGGNASGNTYHGQQQHQKYRKNEEKSSTFNQQLDRNLDEMCGSLSKLKGLAIDLNQEIESQNDLIDSIGNKVENVDVKVKRQNKEMNHLLGRK